VQVLNTVKQTRIGPVSYGTNIDICLLANAGIISPDQLNFRAVATNATSVDFQWHSKPYHRENVSPFSLCGDSGEYSYFRCADLKYGYQCISAKPWSMKFGQGTSGNTLTVCFDVVRCPSPVQAHVPILIILPMQAPVHP
jgi:hypothetical protein